jgi:anti-sigma B factor antagonist
MTVETHEQDGVQVVVLRGEVKLGQPTQTLRETSRELVAAGRNDLVLDMLDVPWLDSSGLGEVFATYKRAREHGGEVKLVLRDRAYSLFTLTQLDRVFDIHPDRARAVESLRERRRPQPSPASPAPPPPHARP